MQAVIDRNQALKKAKKIRKSSEKQEIYLEPKQNSESQAATSFKPVKKPHLIEDIWIKNSIQPFRLATKALGKLKDFIHGKKSLDAGFEGEPIKEIVIEKEKSFTWNISLKNNGKERWPENVHLECIQGSKKYFI